MLNEEQIQSLKNYCSSKGVSYYDLEQEIVDHLASVIEEEQIKFPAKSFDEILNEKAPDFSKEWKTMETEKCKALRSEYLREFGQEFAGYFTVPKIAITIAATICTYVFVHFLFRRSGDVNSLSFLFNGSNVVISLVYGKKYIKMKAIKNARTRQLICYNVYKKLNCLSAAIVLAYLLSMIYFDSVYKKETSHTAITMLLTVYPIFFISMLSCIKVRFQSLSKMKNNYPLAFS